MSSDFEPPEIVSLKCERDVCTNRNTDGHILRKCSGCRRVYLSVYSDGVFGTENLRSQLLPPIDRLAALKNVSEHGGRSTRFCVGSFRTRKPAGPCRRTIPSMLRGRKLISIGTERGLLPNVSTGSIFLVQRMARGA